MEVVQEGIEVLVATDGGYAKRTIEEYPVQGRGGKGVLTARIMSDDRGGLVGALTVRPGRRALRDHLQRRRHPDDRRRGPAGQRQTMGVRLMNLPDGVSLVAIARNADEPRRAGVAG